MDWKDGGAWKIQKGEIQKVFERDLKYLGLITKLVDFLHFLPPLDHLVTEYSTWLKEETDFVNEYNNLKNAKKLSFEPLIRTKTVLESYSPDVFGVHVSSDNAYQVLRMELIDGQNLNSINAILEPEDMQRKKIIDQALRGFMAQFLIIGFCQADPHISNLMWDQKHQKLYFASRTRQY